MLLHTEKAILPASNFLIILVLKLLFLHNLISLSRQPKAVMTRYQHNKKKPFYNREKEEGKEQIEADSASWNTYIFKNHVNFISQGNAKSLSENTPHRTACSVVSNSTTAHLAKRSHPQTRSSPQGREQEKYWTMWSEVLLHPTRPWSLKHNSGLPSALSLCIELCSPPQIICWSSNLLYLRIGPYLEIGSLQILLIKRS